MGLDISLYTKAEHEQSERHWREWEALWERYERGEITEEKRSELVEDITEYASHESPPSEKYPDHLFNRRYLRSSYNSGGFNRAVPDLVGEDHGLYWIFEPLGREWDGDEGGLAESDIPALNEARKRAEQVAGELGECDRLRAEAIHGPLIGPQDHMWSKLPGEAEVLTWYREHARRERRPFDGGGFSDAKGTVLGFEKGMEVLAITVGKFLFSGSAPIIVYRLDQDVLDSYIQSAEITAEFIEEAISLIERDGAAYISWSG